MLFDRFTQAFPPPPAPVPGEHWQEDAELLATRNGTTGRSGASPTAGSAPPRGSHRRPRRGRSGRLTRLEMVYVRHDAGKGRLIDLGLDIDFLHRFEEARRLRQP